MAYFCGYDYDMGVAAAELIMPGLNTCTLLVSKAISLSFEPPGVLLSI